MNEPASNVDRPHNWHWLVLVAAALLVFAPIGFYGCGEELDRWRVAARMEEYLDGQRGKAITGLREIVARRPGNLYARLVLADWLVDNGEAGEALELVEEVPPASRGPALQTVLMDCLLANGKTAEALQIYRELNPPNLVRDPDSLRHHLNALSYFQALDGSELDQALKNSSHVVAETAEWWNRQTEIELEAGWQAVLGAALVYRGSSGRLSPGKEPGSVLYRDEILDALDQMIALLQRRLESAREASEQTPQFRIPFSILAGADAALREGHQSRAEIAAGALAVFLTARALVWQDLGETERSRADRLAVTELGHDPEELVSRWPGRAETARHVTELAMFLDTRGCVWFRRNELPMALGDLNSAVTAQEALVQTGATYGLAGTADLREHRQQFEELPRKMLAVLLWHRVWVYRDLGFDTRVARDLARIRELGYTPGDHLF